MPHLHPSSMHLPRHSCRLHHNFTMHFSSTTSTRCAVAALKQYDAKHSGKTQISNIWLLTEQHICTIAAQSSSFAQLKQCALLYSCTTAALSFIFSEQNHNYTFAISSSLAQRQHCALCVLYNRTELHIATLQHSASHLLT